jgi:hypothetical protein
VYATTPATFKSTKAKGAPEDVTIGMRDGRRVLSPLRLRSEGERYDYIYRCMLRRTENHQEFREKMKIERRHVELRFPLQKSYGADEGTPLLQPVDEKLHFFHPLMCTLRFSGTP